MATKPEKAAKVTEVFSATYEKPGATINLSVIKDKIDKHKLSGYVQREGQLSDGNTFAVLYVIIKP